MKLLLSAFAFVAVSVPAFAGVLVSSDGSPVKSADYGTCVRVIDDEIPVEFFAACGVEVPATK